MSFKISLSRKDRIASRFLAQLHAAFANAAAESKKVHGLNQRKVADELGVDKAVVSRILSGGGNPTARTIGELAAALGYRPELLLHRIDQPKLSNHMQFKVSGNTITYGAQTNATVVSAAETSPAMASAGRPISSAERPTVVLGSV